MAIYIEARVKTAMIVHGYDQENQEVVESIDDSEYTRKLIQVDRILSISEDFLLVSSNHGRVMYWHYDESLDEIKQRLLDAGIVIG
ncbi:hypothetical protein [Pleionea litopenaei]|uniref:Uncharacterized protein n=1 Tax=Pleionea litopenaei TaxID=3070815 RepID=A0AA51RSJ1_9GAMM|nr:hypothetical protein [Pleionea sp. HL-JVS1]WMS86777.1 hypothetical protein Q9312_16265 [Pleionea sp. HL-JVS1]